MKINLTVGGYKDEQGKPWVLPVVRETEVVDIFFNLRTFFCQDGSYIGPCNHS